MTAALRKVSDDDAFRAGRAPCQPTLLAHLRHVARDSRCKSYVDLFGACTALSSNPHVAKHAASDVLIRCLSQALGRRPVLFRVAERETSFDEDWLMALARSLKNDDLGSATFLLNSRVPRHLRRNLVFLLRRVIDNFAEI